MKKHFFLIAFFILVSTNAQIKDSIKMPFFAKFNLQQKIPEGKITTSDGKVVDFTSYIKKNRVYKNKPVVIICWLSYHAYGNKIIDEIMVKRPYDKYNMVFVNLEGAKDEGFILKTNSNYPQFITNGISLYDTEKLFTFGRETFSVLFFWLDENLKLVTSSFPLNSITASQLEHVLDLVDAKKIVPSSTKFFDNNLIPTDEKDATFKQVFTETGATANLKLSTINSQEMQYDLNFKKDASGQYFYIKTKGEEKRQSRKKEIIVELQRILAQQNGTAYNHIKDREYLFSDYKIKDNSITYSLVGNYRTKKYSNTTIRWDLLEKIETVKELEKMDMIFTFSQSYVRISPDVDTITDTRLKIRVPSNDIENLKKLFNELSDLVKQEK